MKFVLLLTTLAFSITTSSAQINFGEKPDLQKGNKAIVYDGKHNIELQDNNGKYNLKHLIGQVVTYLGINDRLGFYVPDPDSDSESWKYEQIDPTPLRYKSFHIVDASSDWLCLIEENGKDSIFANGLDSDLSANFIVQKHYELVKSSCVGKVYRMTGASRRTDFLRDYITRKVHSVTHGNDIKKSTDLKCIDVFVDTVHYNLEMSPDNEDFFDNLDTSSGSRLCLLFETENDGRIFCPVEESEVMDPARAKNWLNMGPVLTLKDSSDNQRPTKIVRKSNKR